MFKTPVCCQMIQQADPGAVQYGSVIPQLATHMSALQIGNGSVSLTFYGIPLHFRFLANTINLLNILLNEYCSTTHLLKIVFS